VGTAKRERQKANRQQRLEQIAQESRRKKTRSRIIKFAIIIPAVIGLLYLLVFLTGDDSDDTPVATTPPATDPATSDPATSDPATSDPGEPREPNIVSFEYGTGECAPDEKPAEPVLEFDDAPQQCIDPEATYTATFETSKGTIEVLLDTATVPGTVNNFVNLARFGYYDGTPIFRTDPSIDIIQGGGADNTTGPGYTIPDEGIGFTYEAGDLTMARTSAPNSSGAQWFFVAGPAASALDGQGTYVNFGTVTEGLEVVQDILALAGDDGQTPTEDVTLTSVTITES
jgi:cyclophilin family peptidyl-prolyl cis-trans isomerase